MHFSDGEMTNDKKLYAKNMILDMRWGYHDKRCCERLDHQMSLIGNFDPFINMKIYDWVGRASSRKLLKVNSCKVGEFVIMISFVMVPP